MQPRVIREIAKAHQWVRESQARGERVGLVPTMGAIHAGHLSLVTAAQQSCSRIAATIFINPTQFGPGEDLEQYPRTWSQDLELLAEEQVDVVFAPAVESMYPVGSDASSVMPSRVGQRWEGERRPAHFAGVATVVLKLFQIMPADVAFFGEKDFQQCRVIADLVRDFNLRIGLEFLPIARADDGLALSSRNRYLSEDERRRALSLNQGLNEARAAVSKGERNAQAIETLVRRTLEQASVDGIDYVAVVSASTLEPIVELTGDDVVLVAAQVGQTRLIDNTRLTF